MSRRPIIYICCSGPGNGKKLKKRKLGKRFLNLEELRLNERIEETKQV